MSAKALIIEDRGSFGPALARQLERYGVAARWMPHSAALTQGAATLAAADLLFVDALDLGRQQADPTASRLASLDVLMALTDATPARLPRTIVYSTAMGRPELNVPLRQTGVPAEFFTADAVTGCLDAIVAGDTTSAVLPPTVDDWADLHPDLPVGADVAAAHQRMRTHDRAWRQIWDPDASFDKAAQVWVSRNVLPVLGVDRSTGYRVAVEVIRKVAGLPFTLL